MFIEPTLTNPNSKKISIFFPLTIPATGKTTIFTHLTHHLKQYYLRIVSSDGIRSEEMEKVLGKGQGSGEDNGKDNKDQEKEKEKDIEKGNEEVKEQKRREAYLKTKDSADREFYARVQKILEEIETVDGDEYKGYGIFLDKNYSKLTLDNAILQIKKVTTKFQNLPKTHIKLIGILPKTNTSLTLPNTTNSYPFSLPYLCCCLKRLLSRSSHPTLFGPKNHLLKTCLYWAKNQQNLTIPPPNIDGIVRICFTKEQEIPGKIQEYVGKLLMDGEVGKYRGNYGGKDGGKDGEVGVGGEMVEELVGELGKWEMEEVEIKGIEEEAREEFGMLFGKF